MPELNGGAMENSSLNIFDASLVLACPATATDDDYMAVEREWWVHKCELLVLLALCWCWCWPAPATADDDDCMAVEQDWWVDSERE